MKRIACVLILLCACGNKGAAVDLGVVQALADKADKCPDLPCVTAIQRQLGDLLGDLVKAKKDLSTDEKKVLMDASARINGRATLLDKKAPTPTAATPTAATTSGAGRLTRAEIFDTMRVACDTAFAPKVVDAKLADAMALLAKVLVTRAEQVGAKLPAAPAATGNADTDKLNRMDHVGRVEAVFEDAMAKKYPFQDTLLLQVGLHACALRNFYDPAKPATTNLVETVSMTAEAAGLDKALLVPLADKVKSGAPRSEVFAAVLVYVKAVDAALEAK